ncbi:hypothetical protein K470DRAFT_259642 [Piedraia hortae CBS 480.64]|uniref:Uncharacterized protein n=1 Tax=Piedraia hortae CBS 480.64 TaxID=1314780 RepID=A0A6A7BU04_9PEZI|nr:hypothetical protein K470DRAFT_259642 [Piedraia hortae CBS 480.64]
MGTHTGRTRAVRYGTDMNGPHLQCISRGQRHVGLAMWLYILYMVGGILLSNWKYENWKFQLGVEARELWVAVFIRSHTFSPSFHWAKCQERICLHKPILSSASKTSIYLGFFFRSYDFPPISHKVSTSPKKSNFPLNMDKVFSPVAPKTRQQHHQGDSPPKTPQFPT